MRSILFGSLLAVVVNTSFTRHSMKIFGMDFFLAISFPKSAQPRWKKSAEKLQGLTTVTFGRSDWDLTSVTGPTLWSGQLIDDPVAVGLSPWGTGHAVERYGPFDMVL